MKRIVTLIAAAGTAGLMLFSTAASAHDRDDDGRYDQGRYEQRAYDHGRYDDGWRRADHERREHEWHELQEARNAFYARWNGNPWRRARFERWYQQRCNELRYRG